MKGTRPGKLPRNANLACHKKIPYRTKQQAQAAVGRNEKRIGDKLNYYECILCGQYHIGHIPYWRQSNG